MDMPDNLKDLSFAKFGAATLGSFVALNFVKGATRPQLFMMWVSGSAVSWYTSSPVSTWFHMENAEGMVGLFIGLFGMAIVAKVYEVIQMVDAKQVAADGWAWILRKWGA